MMDPARWVQLEELFHQAVALPGAERSAFIDNCCGDDAGMRTELMRMVEEDDRASLLDRNVADIAAEVLASGLPKELGPYRILRLLGEGGMGVVYLAERSDLGNLVAIKVLRDAWLSPGRLDRFRTEQRILARLNHPSVARLYDANMLPDGTPWFVMEYVDGLPISDFSKLNGCSVDARLRLLRAVTEAVQYLHEHHVVHRDLKPSNILVKPDGTVRVVDFGIAKQLTLESQSAAQTRTALRPMTLAYASPEQIRGEAIGPSSDIYSLGVVMYELLTGRLPFDVGGKPVAAAEAIITTTEPQRPSSRMPREQTATKSHDLDAICLTAMRKDPAQRYPSATAMLGDLERYLAGQRVEARYSGRRKQRTMWAATALIAAALTFAFVVRDRKPPVQTGSRTVAVLPFENLTAEQSQDFLAYALSDEIAKTLSYARSLTLRGQEAAGRYGVGHRNLQTAGRELRVGSIVSGHFLKDGDRLQITVEITDVEQNRLLWSDVFDAPMNDLVAMEALIAAKARRALAPVLGVPEFVTNNMPKPRNEEAYRLFLRARAEARNEISTKPEARKRAMDMLRQSLKLDPDYAPALEDLSNWYSSDALYGHGGSEAFAKWRTLADKAMALDPDDVVFRASVIYLRSSSESTTGTYGGMSKGEAYRALQQLLKRRPDSARIHFLMSWLLRDAGVLDESARECETSILIDAQDSGARSCSVTFMLLGKYARARDFAQIDPTSEVSRAVSMDILARQGEWKKALAVPADQVPTWGGFNVMMAYLRNRPAEEIGALAAREEPVPDSEVNYFSAAHLSQAGLTDASLKLLREAIAGGYCSVPGIDQDPFFANVRRRAEFAAIHSEAVNCRNRFLAQRR